MLGTAVIHGRRGEVADARVGQPRHHRLFGKLHHAEVHHHGAGTGTHAALRTAAPARRPADRRATCTSAWPRLRYWSGNAVTCSMKLRLASMPRPRTRARALISGTSLRNSRVTSITGASFGPNAAIGNDMTMDGLLAACTALAIGSPGSADDVVGDLAQEHAILAPFPAAHHLVHGLPAVARADGVLARSGATNRKSLPSSDGGIS